MSLFLDKLGTLSEALVLVVVAGFPLLLTNLTFSSVSRRQRQSCRRSRLLTTATGQRVDAFTFIAGFP